MINRIINHTKLLILACMIFTCQTITAQIEVPDKALEKRAKSGDVKSMVELGNWYAARKSNIQYSKKAHKWYKNAWKNGSQEAAVLYAGAIADKYDGGKEKLINVKKVLEGVKDSIAGERFLEKYQADPKTAIGHRNLFCAAELGNAKACYILGVLYANDDMLIYSADPIHSMRKANNYAPAIIWLHNYAESGTYVYPPHKKLINDNYLRLQENPQLVTWDDVDFIARQGDQKILYELMSLKRKNDVDTRCIDILEGLYKDRSKILGAERIMTIIGALIPLSSPTEIIDGLRKFSADRVPDLYKFSYIMDLASTPERRNNAFEYLFKSELKSNEKASIESVAKTLIRKGDNDGYKYFIKLTSNDVDELNTSDFQLYFDAFENGILESEPFILKRIRQKCSNWWTEYNLSPYIKWLDDNAQKGSADFQGFMGEIYASIESYPYTKAKYWLDMAAKNGNSSYKQKYIRVYETPKSNPTPQKTKSPQPKQQQQQQPKGGIKFQESGLKR